MMLESARPFPVLVLAAGKGTRLGPAPVVSSKVLLDVDGMSVLERNLRWLAAGGLTSVWINLHHEPEAIRSAIGDGSRLGITVQYVFEPELLGTAGAFANVARHMKGPALVVYGDNLMAFDLNRLILAHRRSGAEATLALFDRGVHPHSGMAGGRVVLNPDSRIVAFQEGTVYDREDRFLVNAGAYVLERSVLDWIPASSFQDFGRDVFPCMLAAGRALVGHVIESGGYCVAFDTPESVAAGRSLVERGSVRLSESGMIATRTPFSVTLGGAGTDEPSYYTQHGGFVLAMAISHYMYVMVNRRVIDRKIILHYSESEIVDRLDDLHHDRVREALRSQGIRDGIEVASIADLPRGTGVGSSSSFLVGLLLALHHYRRDFVSLERLATEACQIECDVLKKRAGRHDHYVAAYGGLTALEIDTAGKIEMQRLDLSRGAQADLVANSHIYYTGTQRAVGETPAQQEDATPGRRNPSLEPAADSLSRIKAIAHEMFDAIKRENFDRWGQLLAEHWLERKRLAHEPTATALDSIYDEVRSHYDVLGGQLMRPGEGFLLLYCSQGHKRLEEFMAGHGMPRLHYAVEPEGAKVIANFARGRVPAVFSQ